ncbi:MAG: hypothetical protein CMJ94_02455 [Planctomycetes bacterium]|nr:hypothetical protein [Planctomycetota bacterium]
MRGCAAALLAGGSSSRFPGNKLQLQLPGDPRSLARRAAEQFLGLECAHHAWLAPAAPEPGALPDGWDWLQDPGRGPAAALASALRHAEAQGLDAVLLLAADLPLIQTRHLQALLEQLPRLRADPQTPPVCALDAQGRPQPLCALYATRHLLPLSALLDEGKRSMHALLERGWSGVELAPEVTVSVTSPRAGRATIHPCFNLNREQDWEQLLAWSKEGKLP